MQAERQLNAENVTYVTEHHATAWFVTSGGGSARGAPL